jgi:hypothetical protein
VGWPLIVLGPIRVPGSEVQDSLGRPGVSFSSRISGATGARIWAFKSSEKFQMRPRTVGGVIREGIELLLRQEDEQPSGWTVGRPRRG